MPSSWTNGGKKGKDLRGKKKGKEVAHCSRSLLTNMPQLAFPLLRLLEQEGRHKEKQYTYVSISTEMLNSCDRFRNDTARMEIKKIQNEASLQNLVWSLQKFQVHEFLFLYVTSDSSFTLNYWVTFMFRKSILRYFMRRRENDWMKAKAVLPPVL